MSSNEEQVVTVFVTKYALTQGILEIDGSPSKRSPDMFVSLPDWTNSGLTAMYHKPYWHETMAVAVEHAEQMRLQRIESLKRSIPKLERLNFS